MSRRSAFAASGSSTGRRARSTRIHAPSRPPELSIVVPARNESTAIRGSLVRLSRYLEGLQVSYELILGDSGSTDGTMEESLSLDLPHFRAVREDEPGKGRILTTALRQARGNVIGFIDADLELPESTLGALLTQIQDGADVAIASKPYSDDRRPVHRRGITRAFNRLVRTLFGTPFADHQAGCKLFRSSVLRPILPHVRSSGWLWDTEVLVFLHRAQASVVEVPVTLSENLRESRVTRLGLLRTMLELVHLRARGPSGALRSDVRPASAARQVLDAR